MKFQGPGIRWFLFPAIIVVTTTLAACGGRGIVAASAPTSPSSPTNPSGGSPAPSPAPAPAPAPEKHSVALHWHASASPVMGYNIYRGTNHGGPYTRINPELEPGTVYTDYTVKGGTTYYYVVTSVDANTEGGYSSEITAQVPSP